MKLSLDMRLRSQLLTRFSSSNKGLEISTLFFGTSFIATFEFWNELRFHGRQNYWLAILWLLSREKPYAHKILRVYVCIYMYIYIN